MIALMLAAALLGPLQEDIDRAEATRLVLEEYGLPTAEALAAQGFEGVRILKTTQTYFHWPAAAILRQGSGPASLQTWDDSAFGTVAKSAPADAWAWTLSQTVASEVAASPDLAPIPFADETDAYYREILWSDCGDEPFVIVEVIAKGAVSRRLRRACQADTVARGADALVAQIAIDMPGCRHLRYAEEPWHRISLCGSIEGPDPDAAASLSNHLFANPAVSPSFGTLEAMKAQLTPRAILTVAGQADLSGPAIADWWMAQAKTHANWGFLERTISAGGATAKVTGVVVKSHPESPTWSLRAEAQQTWVRVGNDWRLSRMIVGEWSDWNGEPDPARPAPAATP